MANVGLKDLLEAGIYIIDLQRTMRALNKACDFLKTVGAKGGTVLFVGTKKQAKVAIREMAEKAGMPYVTERWLGGMLTNHQTIYKSVQKLDEIEAMMNDGRMENFSNAVFIVDTAEEETAVREANKLGIPVIGIVDTNCDPTLVTFPIPGNDDAIRAITLFTRVVAESIEEGRNTKAEGKDQGVDMAAAKEEPKAASATLSGDDSKVEAAAAESAEGSETAPKKD